MLAQLESFAARMHWFACCGTKPVIVERRRQLPYVAFAHAVALIVPELVVHIHAVRQRHP